MKEERGADCYRWLCRSLAQMAGRKNAHSDQSLFHMTTASVFGIRSTFYLPLPPTLLTVAYAPRRFPLPILKRLSRRRARQLARPVIVLKAANLWAQLLAVQLYDQLFVNILVNIFTTRHRGN